VSDLFRRIRRATRASLNDLKRRTFGSEDKSLSELSDAELEEELLRRRRRRARGRSGGAPRREDDTPQAKQVLQWYANLELEPGASLEEIEEAYKRLMKKYHPDKHQGDPEKYRAATELAQSLTRAFQALSERAQKRRS